MSNNLLLSVIIPVYNAEKYIKDCITSIMRQTYDNLEVLLIDDGSSDKSGQICEQMSSCDNRISTVHIDNKGVSFARNIGVSLAKGDYISFVDSDDQLAPNMFEALIDASMDGSIDIIQCGYYFVSPNGNVLSEYSFEELIENENKRWNLFLPEKKISNSVWNKIFHRRVFSRVHFDETIRIGEDFKYVLQCCSLANKIRLIPFPLYFYYDRPSSVMNSSTIDKRFDDFVVNDWCVIHFNDDLEMVKRINTRDIICCVDVYYLSGRLIGSSHYKKIIKKRIKSNKIRYRLGGRYEFYVIMISHFSFILDLVLLVRFGVKSLLPSL